MATETTIYVFKLSKATEFPGGVADVIKWIEQRRTADGYYHFRSHTPRNVRAGSIVLFEIEGKIIGQGIVKEELQPTPKERIHQGGHDYPYFITFEPLTFLLSLAKWHIIEFQRKHTRHLTLSSSRRSFN